MARRTRLAHFALAAVGRCMMTLAGEIALATNRHHNSGPNFGAKLRQIGKHEIDQIGNNAITADVNNEKVVSMSAGTLPAKKMKLRAGVLVYAYGYWFDRGLDEYCYWYPPRRRCD